MAKAPEFEYVTKTEIGGVPHYGAKSGAHQGQYIQLGLAEALADVKETGVDGVYTNRSRKVEVTVNDTAASLEEKYEASFRGAGQAKIGVGL